MMETAEHGPVLVVEDHDDIRELMVEILRDAGYHVVAAADGIEAFDRLRAGPLPCLILLDMLMPRKNGLQFRTEQMQDPSFAGIPVVAYSSDRGMRPKALALGAVAFFEKPIDEEKLLGVLRRYC
jgi:two-component system response regulator MprA